MGVLDCILAGINILWYKWYMLVLSWNLKNLPLDSAFTSFKSNVILFTAYMPKILVSCNFKL